MGKQRQGDHCKFEANLVSKIKASLDYMVWLHPLLKLFIFVWDKINYAGLCSLNLGRLREKAGLACLLKVTSKALD